MTLEDIDAIAKMADTYRRLAKLELDLRRNWACSRIGIEIEWHVNANSDTYHEAEFQEFFRVGFASVVKSAREQVQAKLALLGVDQFPEVE